MVNMRRQSLNEEGALKQDIHHIHEAEKIFICIQQGAMAFYIRFILVMLIHGDRILHTLLP
jgi:hypothetical protein